MFRIATIITAAIGLAAASFAAERDGLQKGPYKLQIKLEQFVENDWLSVDPAHVFDSGDRVRFVVQANFDGYLYVSNQGTSGKFISLFPSEDAGENNRIEAGKDYVVPQTEGAFRIQGPAGHEIVYWTLTPARVGEPDPLPPDRPAAPQGPVRMDPRCDETIMRARGECVDHSAGMKRDGDETRSRSLVFLKKEDTSVVAAPQQLAGPVTFEFRLAHR